VALVAHAESLVALAAEQRNQAATAVRIAEKNLSDAKVIAPLSGVVSQRLQEVGEMGGPAKPVFRIVDLSRLEVSAFLPAQHYAAIVVGHTRMSVRIGSVEQRDRLVSYRAPTIDPQLRVFEIKCLLETPPDSVAPGAMASVTVVLRREEGLGVPKEAISQRDGKDVLFRLEGDTARQTQVEAGMETAGWVQVGSEALAEGTAVVTMGQFLLNDGAKVDRRGDAAKPDVAAAQAGAVVVDAAAAPAAAVRKEN
jgi:RND family efflux transporter MFP subunit